MTPRCETLTGAAISSAIEDLARLRTEVFRDWPYLYDGDPANESKYLRSYRNTPNAILIAAMDGDRVVGCATGMPLSHHQDARDLPLTDLGLRLEDVFYCAESVLLPEYRGRGLGHVFFDRREAHAKALGFKTALFCAVERPDSHPARPQNARSLAPFWKGRGYTPRDAFVRMHWTDLGDNGPSKKQLRVWTHDL
ncbi:GNAT family N-acetyltransferase [Palleronia caenipelagi]|uniref:GNAT family N-acetyltransferase n=1 Tax=Palleronia caenipelagi TaxID=2489174 RepID=A0A547Q8A5_9RHOB|nr:GNAT family N-acetyltransferase [Palleronia caenipelagi]TRD22617.1 GNAT family N-acetyltransferase [Palleronia caenipelagi]